MRDFWEILAKVLASRVRVDQVRVDTQLCLGDVARRRKVLLEQHARVTERAARDARLALATAVAQVIRNGLALLGVSAPESM
jgi:hypothetical protein